MDGQLQGELIGMGLLQQTMTWYKIRHAGGRAHYYSPTGALKQRSVKLEWLRSLCFNVTVRVYDSVPCRGDDGCANSREVWVPGESLFQEIFVCCGVEAFLRKKNVFPPLRLSRPSYKVSPSRSIVSKIKFNKYSVNKSMLYTESFSNAQYYYTLHGMLCDATKTHLSSPAGTKIRKRYPAILR